jgi:NAD-dependent DNA ligase
MRKGTLNALAKSGHYTIPSILKLNEADIASIAGFGERKAAMIVKAIKSKTASLPLATLMDASDIFSDELISLGKTRLETIVEYLGENRVLTEKIKYDDIRGVAGIGQESALMFANNLPYFIAFYRDIKGLVNVRKPVTGKLSGQSFCFTGFRDEKIEEMIAENGGKIGGLTKATTVLYCASRTTEKAKKAESYGTKIVAAEDAMKDILKRIKK